MTRPVFTIKAAPSSPESCASPGCTGGIRFEIRRDGKRIAVTCPAHVDTVKAELERSIPAPPTPWRIRRTEFSRLPWRLVAADGTFVALGSEAVDLPGAPPTLPVLGAATKAECIDLVCDLLAREANR